jgi:hypothetical protein
MNDEIKDLEREVKALRRIVLRLAPDQFYTMLNGYGVEIKARHDEYYWQRALHDAVIEAAERTVFPPPPPNRQSRRSARRLLDHLGLLEPDVAFDLESVVLGHELARVAVAVADRLVLVVGHEGDLCGGANGKQSSGEMRRESVSSCLLS